MNELAALLERSKSDCPTRARLRLRVGHRVYQRLLQLGLPAPEASDWAVHVAQSPGLLHDLREGCSDVLIHASTDFVTLDLFELLDVPAALDRVAELATGPLPKLLVDVGLIATYILGEKGHG